MLGNDLLRTAVQIACPGVVPQPTPQAHYFILRRRRQSGHIRKACQESTVVIQHGTDLGLLEHDLRQPHSIRISGLLPRQLIATMGRLPSDHTFSNVRSYAVLHADTSNWSLADSFALGGATKLEVSSWSFLSN